MLFALAVASFASGYIALPATFTFTFLVPGLIASKFFKLERHELWAVVPVVSVLVSVQMIYWVSVGIGYSRETILGCLVILAAAYTLVTYRKGEPLPLQSIPGVRHLSRPALVVFTLIFVICAVVLARSVWFTNQDGVVITGSNWQDTPLHYEIPESINQGNFPPQVPYFSGVALNYHYFVDLHTAILEKTFGYLPQLLPFLNAVFIVIFSLSIYALARERGKRAAIISVIIAVFGWGFSYVGLFSALNNSSFNPGTNYIYQYGQLFGLPTMFDNLLQQRPLLMGLPAFAVVLLLLLKKPDKRRMLLAGIITGLVYPFHVVSFLCCLVTFVVFLAINIKSLRVTHLLAFAVPVAIALPFFLSGTSAFHPLPSISFVDNFVMAKPVTASFLQPVAYYVLNLGIPFLLAIVSFVKKGDWLLKGVLLFVFLIPNLSVLTPNAWDMYKFLMFAWVPIATLSGALLAKPMTRFKGLGKVLVAILILLSVLSAVSVVAYNVGTSYTAASWDEYNLGLWVRDNTPHRSVFLTVGNLNDRYVDTIHSPVTMIGGRLRVSSYFNWPYGQGIPYNEIVQHDSDIYLAYTGNETDLRQVVKTYNVSFIYVGNAELSAYPGCVQRFSSISWLQQVYGIGDLHVYKVTLPSSE